MGCNTWAPVANFGRPYRDPVERGLQSKQSPTSQRRQRWYSLCVGQRVRSDHPISSKATSAAVPALAFSADEQFLASSDVDGGVCVWQLDQVEPLYRLQGHSDEVHALLFAGIGSLPAAMIGRSAFGTCATVNPSHLAGPSAAAAFAGPSARSRPWPVAAMTFLLVYGIYGLGKSSIRCWT